MRRVGEDLAARALLDDPARVHDREPAAERRERREVVRDEDDREPELPLKLLEETQDLRLNHDVEGRRGLVRDEQARPACERERDEHPLPLPAGELVRVVASPAVGDPHELEQLPDAAPHLRPPGSRLVDDDRLLHLRPDALDRVQRVERALEDDRELGPADGAQAPRPHREDVLAVEQHLALDARPAGQDAQEGPRECRLPGPGLAREAERLAGGHVERDAADGRHVARVRDS
jgi:hypothetical protein